MNKTRKIAKKRVASTQSGASSGTDQAATVNTSNTSSSSDASSWHEQYDATEFVENLTTASALWQQIVGRLTSSLIDNPPATLTIGHSDPFHMSESFLHAMGRLAANPSALLEKQMHLAHEHLMLWHQTTQRLLGKNTVAPEEVSDRRFKAHEWAENPYFDYLRRSYLINSNWMQSLLANLEGLEPHTAQKIRFFMRQVLDAVAPSNFAATNPLVLKTLLESNGASLVRGLQAMLADIEDGNGTLRVRMTNKKAFELGKNIACTPGSVVYENDLIQLIQYSPTTPQVHERPLLFVPAWINKFYVLDLSPENSLVRWAVEQGHTVFMISWVNPSEAQGKKSFDDYLNEGPLAALEVIEAITGSTKTNILGYCLGGTLVACTLAYLRAQNQQSRIASATYLTTMVDFTEAGELGVFIDESQISSLEQRMNARGFLEGSDMATTFNMLRANDLIWSFVVNNYLLGKEPMAFDLLYWNSDSTRMPATMHSFYLRNMYQKNLLAKPCGIELMGTPINITKIDTPSYILATKDDHIAPWISTYAATQIYDAPMRFVLSQSGHVAGVVNPPAKNKYGFWSSEVMPPRAQTWLDDAEFSATSWWTDWLRWMADYAGKKVKARTPGSKKYPPIEAAPGSYVRTRA